MAELDQNGSGDFNGRQKRRNSLKDPYQKSRLPKVERKRLRIANLKSKVYLLEQELTDLDSLVSREVLGRPNKGIGTWYCESAECVLRGAWRIEVSIRGKLCDGLVMPGLPGSATGTELVSWTANRARKTLWSSKWRM